MNGGRYMAQDFQNHKAKMKQQIEEQYGKLLYTYVTHIYNASFLKKDEKRFKWAQIVLSAISTGGFIATVVTDQAKLAWIGGIISTLLLVVSGYLKDKDFSQEQQQHLKVADALWPIREDYISLLTDFESLEEKEIAEQREKLKKATAKIYEGAIQTDARSYAEAQKQLKDKEHQFFTRDELNKILPEHLRH